MPFAQENTRKYYADNRELAEDIAAGYKSSLPTSMRPAAAISSSMTAAGACWSIRWRARSLTPTKSPLKAIKEQLLELNNMAIAGKPDDLVINTHVCRGNFHSTYVSSDAYDGVAQTLLARENVGAYYLEFDDARSGGFAPLAAVSGDKKVVLGLVTTKRAQLEDKDAVIARIHEAEKYLPLDRLCLSPQCGFASCEIGNKLTEAEQWAKARAGQGNRRGSLGLRPRISKSFLKKPLRSYPQRLFPCCFLFDMFPDKAIPLPLRSDSSTSSSNCCASCFLSP